MGLKGGSMQGELPGEDGGGGCAGGLAGALREHGGALLLGAAPLLLVHLLHHLLCLLHTRLHTQTAPTQPLLLLLDNYSSAMLCCSLLLYLNRRNQPLLLFADNHNSTKLCCSRLVWLPSYLPQCGAMRTLAADNSTGVQLVKHVTILHCRPATYKQHKPKSKDLSESCELCASAQTDEVRMQLV